MTTSVSIRIFETGRPGETYNIGGGAERENIQIVHYLCDLMDECLKRSGADGSRRLIRFVSDRPGHDRRYAIDASKIKRELGWVPRYSFEDALAETLDWYLTHMEWVESVRSGEYRDWIEKNNGKRKLNLSALKSSLYRVGYGALGTEKSFLIEAPPA